MMASRNHDEISKSEAFHDIRVWVERLVVGTDPSCPRLIGVGGPGGCGKSTLVHWLALHLSQVAVLHLDDFRLARPQRPTGARYGSHPDANDLALLNESVRRIRSGEPGLQPVFEPERGVVSEIRQMTPATVVLVDGEIAAHASIRKLWDHLIVVDSHWRVQLNTRLSRDIRTRKCSLEKAIEIFLQSNLRDYPKHSTGAWAAADWVLYRSTRGQFRIRKRPGIQ